MMVFVLSQDAMLMRYQARFDNEAEKRICLANGDLGLDIYNMRPRLADAGFEYVDTLDELDTFNGINCQQED